MELAVVSQLEQLSAIHGEWDRLSVPSPMQSREWLQSWWETYQQPTTELFIIAAREEGQLVGLAPLYCENHRGRRVLHWLGDGRVCSDHPTLLTEPGYEKRFAEQLANWLLKPANRCWDELLLEAIDADDLASNHLVDRLTAADCSLVVKDQPVSCYVDLPESRHAYEMSLSKNHRKRCRKWTKQFFDTGRAKVYVSTTAKACLEGWQTLVDLHNERRTGLGEAGAFEDSRFKSFHQQVMPRLADAGRVQLRQLELDGQIVAVEYVLQDSETWYAYQSGLSDTGEQQSAGNLSLLALVNDAIEAGCQRLDLLRGDEAYKFSWGAKVRPAQTITLRRRSTIGSLLTLRDTAWQHARQMKRTLISAR